ncbi:ATP synthase subunit b [Zostera marina]|uniref:ATP synthase subunit b n=1 Tax=Zostera marina TaxID=29655 RepID=A0A0K9PIX0_ZOSMR|nr:ATP synthase subunit b [Zostera marina]
MSAAIMASSCSKILPKTIPISSTTTVAKHANHHHSLVPATSPNRFQKLLASIPQIADRSRFSASTASAALAAVLLSSPFPAVAADIEKAALFDFNLTLPIIAAEFLFLMVALDKIYYTPLGDFMDKRDADIRSKLGDVKDTSSEVKEMEDQAAAIMKASRAEISAALKQMKKETSDELEAKLKEGRKKVEAELTVALQSLDKQKEETIKALDSQIASLSDEIVKKVLPTA